MATTIKTRQRLSIQSLKMHKLYFSLTAKQATLILLLLITLLNILIVGRIGLSVDEANYALYGSHLQLSYFDHPPMVGWLQALIIPFSHSNFAMRIWPMLFNIGWSLTLYHLTTTLFPKESPWLGFISVAIVQSAIILNLLAIALIPQVPFLLFALLSILYLYHATQHEKLHHFILLGLCLGLAALSEYTAFLLALLVVLYIGTIKIRLFISYKLWLSALIAIALSLPVFYWNYQHHWIGFHYQTRHVLQNQAWSLLSFFKSQFVQFFAYSPGIYIFGLLAIITACKEWSNKATRLLLLASLLILLFFAYSSGRNVTLPHWTAVAWVCSSILSARFLVRHWRKIWVKISVYFSLIYSLLIILIVHFYVIFSYPHFPLQKNPLIDLYGWKHAALVGKSLADEAHLPLFVSNWTFASRIAWYAKMPVQITEFDSVSQQSLWYGQPTNGDNGILIIPYRASPPVKHGSRPGEFKDCHLIKLLNVKKQQQLINQFKFYHCQDYIGR